MRVKYLVMRPTGLSVNAARMHGIVCQRNRPVWLSCIGVDAGLASSSTRKAVTVAVTGTAEVIVAVTPAVLVAVTIAVIGAVTIAVIGSVTIAVIGAVTIVVAVAVTAEEKELR